MFTQTDDFAAFMRPKLKDQLTMTDLWMDTALWLWNDWQRLQLELLQRPMQAVALRGVGKRQPNEAVV